MREDIITMVEGNGREKDQKDRDGDGHTHTRRVLHTLPLSFIIYPCLRSSVISTIINVCNFLCFCSTSGFNGDFERKETERKDEE